MFDYVQWQSFLAGFRWVKSPFPCSCNKSKNINMLGMVWCRKAISPLSRECSFSDVTICFVYYMFCILSYWLIKCAFLGTLIVSTPLAIILCILISLFFFSFYFSASAAFPLHSFLIINAISDLIGISVSSAIPFLIWLSYGPENLVASPTMKQSYWFLKRLLCTMLNFVEFNFKFIVHSSPETNLGNHCEHWFILSSCLGS